MNRRTLTSSGGEDRREADSTSTSHTVRRHRSRLILAGSGRSEQSAQRTTKLVAGTTINSPMGEVVTCATNCSARPAFQARTSRCCPSSSAFGNRIHGVPMLGDLAVPVSAHGSISGVGRRTLPLAAVAFRDRGGRSSGSVRSWRVILLDSFMSPPWATITPQRWSSVTRSRSPGTRTPKRWLNRACGCSRSISPTSARARNRRARFHVHDRQEVGPLGVGVLACSRLEEPSHG